ncbi:MAG: hypothetical protein P8X68_15740 [Desulfobacterales bacterium]
MNLHDKELRAVYTDTIIELMTENSNVVCLEADLGKSSGTVPRVKEAFPDRFLCRGCRSQHDQHFCRPGKRGHDTVLRNIYPFCHAPGL